MSTIVDDLTAEVTKVKDVNDKAVALLVDLVTKLNDAKNDPAAIEALIADLDASTQKLSDEVAKDTPAVAAPVVDPAPVVDTTPVDTTVPVDTPVVDVPVA